MPGVALAGNRLLVFLGLMGPVSRAELHLCHVSSLGLLGPLGLVYQLLCCMAAFPTMADRWQCCLCHEESEDPVARWASSPLGYCPLLACSS